MHRKIMQVGGAVALMLCVGPVLADTGAGQSRESSCEAVLQRAAGQYEQCALRAFGAVNDDAFGTEDALETEEDSWPKERSGKKHAKRHERSGGDIERCDARFERAFARAEEELGCRPPGGVEHLMAPIRDQARWISESFSTEVGCPTLTVLEGEHATCEAPTDKAVIDLDLVLEQLALSQDVDENTKVVLQLWGGSGGHGSGGKSGQSGDQGQGGYAQMVLTVGDLLDEDGEALLYYYLGHNGKGHGGHDGGDGGTASAVMKRDLARGSDFSLEDTLLLAPGGGGGGGANGSSKACDGLRATLGGGGGGAGVAISVDKREFVAGLQGGQRRTTNVSGHGGGGTFEGRGGDGGRDYEARGRGNDGFAPIGGGGGGVQDPQNGFYNTSVSFTFGGGPGEGGGSAGGGGGGGGGGALASASTAICSGAPKAKPANPAGDRGHFRFWFDLGACDLDLSFEQ